MLTENVVSIDEVAQAMGLDAQTFKRRLRTTLRGKGFPAPLPGSAWRFSRRAVTDWIEASGIAATAVARAAVQPEAEPVDLDEARTANLIRLQHEALQARYGGRT